MSVSSREYLEFFRVDQTGPTRRFLVPAIVLLTLGPPLVLYSAALKKFPGSHAMGVVGAVLMAAGLVIGFGGIALLLLDDRFVAVVPHGLVVHVGRGNREIADTFYAWDDLRAVELAESGDAIVLVQRAEDAMHVSVPFSKTTARDVAARLEDWRRKSAWNLAPAPRA